MVPDERLIVPASAWDRITAMLETGDYVISAITTLPNMAFEVSRMGREDLVALRSEEGSVGVSFADSLLAATFATLFCLVIYANATGRGSDRMVLIPTCNGEMRSRSTAGSCRSSSRCR